MVSKEKNIFFLAFLIYVNFNFTLRYFKIDGIGDATLWETAIKNYGFEKSSEQPVSLDSITSNIPQGNLSLFEQCTLLSEFPNYHHWNSKKTHGVKKDEYFIEKGRSPRNKAMSLAILAKNFQDLSEENEYFTVNIMTIVKLVLEKNYHVDSIPEISKRSSKKKTTTKKINFVQSDLLQYIGLTDEEYENQKKQSQIALNAYETYKKYLLESGTLLWRIKQADKQVIVMNDYDSEQGDFKV